MPIAIARPVGQRIRRRRVWNSLESFCTDAGLFLLGAAGAFSANIVGSLPGDEILLLPILPALLMLRGRRAFTRQYLWFYVLTGAWLFGTIVADLYAGSPAENRMKGTARVVFFGLDFIALAILLNNKPRRMIIFALSIAAVMLFYTRQFRGDFLTQWKFGFSGAFAILAFLVSGYFYTRRIYWMCVFISLGMAALNLMFAFRSQLAVVLVSAVLSLPLFGQTQKRGHGTAAGRSRFSILILLALAGASAYLANAAIKYAALNGYFSESLQTKFESQAGGDYGVLVGGRPETLVAIQAIRDAPILGHGSFPYGPKYIQMKQDIQYQHGYTESDEPEEVEFPVIPTHSHLTMAWVESGILGGICWIYFFVLTLRSALKLSSMRPNMTPLYSYLLVGFLWDILYSPFGSVNRLWGAYLILLCYNILQPPATEAQLSRHHRAKYINGRQLLRLPRRAAY